MKIPKAVPSHADATTRLRKWEAIASSTTASPSTKETAKQKMASEERSNTLLRIPVQSLQSSPVICQRFRDQQRQHQRVRVVHIHHQPGDQGERKPLRNLSFSARAQPIPEEKRHRKCRVRV